MAEARVSARILVVDDEVGVRESLCEILSEEGYGVMAAEDAESAFGMVGSQPVDMVLLDIWMPPGMDGVSLLRRWRDADMLDFPVVMISAHATLDAAVEAMRFGAKDVLNKPFSSQRLLSVVRQQLATRESNIYDSLLHSAQFGSSEPMARLKGSLLRAAVAAPAPVAVVGSADDAPEFFARLLQRRGLPWVAPASFDEIAEDSESLIKDAAHGTIYVRYADGQDEASQRALSLLMRNAAARGVRIVGEFVQRPDDMHAAGELGADLLRRFAGQVVDIPPLRECRSDLPAVISFVAKRMALDEGKTEGMLSDAAINGLAAEVREWDKDGLSRLLGVLRKAHAKTGSGTRVGAGTMRTLASSAAGGDLGIGEEIFGLPWRDACKIFERQYFIALMRRAKDNYLEAARLSGLERTYLYRKVKPAIASDEPDGKEAGEQ